MIGGVIPIASALQRSNRSSAAMGSAKLSEVESEVGVIGVPLVEGDESRYAEYGGGETRSRLMGKEWLS